MFSLISTRVYIAPNHHILQNIKSIRQLGTSCRLTFKFKVGDTAEISKTFSASDVQTFANLTGDNNPIHVDEEFAKHSRFGRCIVHGVLTNGLISGLLGSTLPGPGALFLSQEIKFPAPLYIDEPVIARVEISSIEGARVDCITTCNAKDKVVMSGTVKLFMMRNSKTNTR